MLHRQVFSLLMVFMLCSCSSKSGIQIITSTPSEKSFIQPEEVHSGELMPSIGEYRAHVIFVRFEGDDTDWNLWPSFPDSTNASIVEPWMEKYIDATPSEKSDNYANVTHFLRVASNETFFLTGDVYYTSVPDSFMNRSYGQANRYVIQSLFGDGDPETELSSVLKKDLSTFDQWSSLERQYHVSEPDSVLDYLIMIYRQPPGMPQPFGGTWQGIAGLGVFEIPLDNGLKARGSGVNVSGVTQLFQRNAAFTFNTLIHEMAHHLVGSPHPYEGGSSLHPSYWGLFYSYMANLSINAYERERLGWIDPHVIKSETARLKLRDFITTGESAVFSLGDNEYLYFENRQKINQTTGIETTYDVATTDPKDKGLAVFRVKTPYSSRTQNLIPIVSDGNYNWEVTDFSEACGGRFSQPVFSRKTPNSLGYSYRDIFTLQKETIKDTGKDIFTLFLNDDIDPDDCHAYMRGRDFSTTFSTKPESKRILSTWTNPPAKYKNGSPFGIHFLIEKEDSDGMHVLFSDNPFFEGAVDSLQIDQDIFIENELSFPLTVYISIDEPAKMYLKKSAVLNVSRKTDFWGIQTLEAEQYTFHDLKNMFPEHVFEWTETSYTVEKAVDL